MRQHSADDATPCQADPERWFSTDVINMRLAKAGCWQGCSLANLDICRERAMEMEGTSSVTYRWGIWGGLDPSERATLSRKRAKKKDAIGVQ